jgi:hypothetical protein
LTSQKPRDSDEELSPRILPTGFCKLSQNAGDPEPKPLPRMHKPVEGNHRSPVGPPLGAHLPAGRRGLEVEGNHRSPVWTGGRDLLGGWRGCARCRWSGLEAATCSATGGVVLAVAGPDWRPRPHRRGGGRLDLEAWSSVLLDAFFFEICCSGYWSDKWRRR